MKKNISKTLTSILFALLLITPSCLDLSEVPENLLTPVTFYSTVGQCESVLVGCMNSLSSTWGGYCDTPGWVNGQGGGRLGYNSNYSTGTWTMHWRVIANVNPVIKAIKDDKLKTESLTAVNDVLGQAYFMRAWQYFWLVQLYGPLPWIDEDTPDLVANPLTPESRLPIATIYDNIEADLEQAFNLMADYNTSRKGRPCKWTAKALLAKVYLTRATAPLNQAANFAKAAAVAEEVIQSGKYELLPITEIFKTSNPNNAEFIHAFQFTADYPAMPGKNWGPEDDWDQWGSGEVRVGWAELFPDQPRKHYYVRTAWPMNLSLANGDDQTTWEWIYYSEHPSQGARVPWDGKKCWPNMTVAQQLTDGGNGGILLPILRISEMYLIFAEADNMAKGGPTEKAVEYLNKIIDRANEAFETPYEELNKYTNEPGTEERASLSMSKTDFDEKVFLERQWELCFEFTAYFDLLRTRRLETWNSESASQNFKETDYLFPIPAYDAMFIENNPGY